MKKTLLYVSGGVIGASLLGSIYWNYRENQREEKALIFIQELNKELKPALSGLKDFKTFDIHYKDRVMKNPPPNLTILRESTARQLAEKIYNSWGLLDDDEGKVVSVFNQIKNHVQGSQVAKAYEKEYEVSLLTDLGVRLNDDEIKPIRTRLKKFTV